MLLIAGILAALAMAEDLPNVPGSDVMGVGIDAITGDFKVQSLFELTFTQGRSWTNPFHPDLRYRVPDQVEVVDGTSSGSMAKLYSTSTEYANDLSQGAGVDGGFGAAFSASAEVSRAKAFLSSGDTSLSVTEETVMLNSLTLLPPQLLKLSDSLRSAIEAHLPAVYDERAYGTFVSYFGSHYVTGAEYGGKATMMSSVKRDYLGDNSQMVANANARVQFQKFKGAEVGASFSHRESSKNYQEACSNSWSIQMVGGNSHLNMSRWGEWTDSVKLAPAQISFRAVPMDRLMDHARAANFRTYLQAYYKKHASTERPVPPPPLRMERCQCFSFPYDSTPQHPDGLLVGMEITGGHHIGGERQACVPCYTLQGKFGGGVAKAEPKMHRSKRALHNTDALFKESLARIGGQMPDRSKPMSTHHNSTCGFHACLPGMDSIGIGFDALYGKVRGLRAVQFTYTESNEWQNPFYKELVYNYADQVQVILDTSNAKSSNTYNDTLQYAQDLAQKAGLTAAAGAYGASAEVGQTRTNIRGSQSVLNVIEQELTLYQISLQAFPKPSAAIMALEAALPSSYEPAAYQAFVNHFGTHFVASAKFGGTARQRSTVDQHYFTNQAGSSIAAGANGMYANFKAGVRVNSSSSEGMKSFANNSISEIQLLGGNYEHLEVHDWSRWQESTRLAPSQVAVTLHSITELFQDATKARVLQEHIDNYIAQGAAKFPRATASRQHPTVVKPQEMPDGQACTSKKGVTLLSNFGHLPVVEGAISPATCGQVTWSAPPRGAASRNSDLFLCDQYETDEATCHKGGFMRSAKYDVGLRGTWEPPITCAHLCWKQ